ncbi:MAG TPA: TrbG/VirB9 family P-type conjugative transfer protein [Thermoanaerobaculia bacterium]|nr:TrbG/VirB9 family P-type conjugative transfer protein [Thermoanaerobaculia bacterium]
MTNKSLLMLLSLALAGIPARATPTESRTVLFGEDVTVKTAVLRATGIILNADERLRSVSQPDGERWQVAWSEYGPEGGTVPVLTVTPSDCGISTNLLVLTTQRIYPIRLESSPCDRSGKAIDPQASFDALVRYRFPDEELVKVVPQPPAEPRVGFDSSVESILAASSRYRWRTQHGWRGPQPSLVTDDGKATYLVFPEGAFAGRDLPLLFLIGEDGERELVTYDVVGTTFRVHGLFTEAVLVAGKPKSARPPQVLIRRKS